LIILLAKWVYGLEVGKNKIAASDVVIEISVDVLKPKPIGVGVLMR
jgi:hypothetical protein